MTSAVELDAKDGLEDNEDKLEAKEVSELQTAGARFFSLALNIWLCHFYNHITDHGCEEVDDPELGLAASMKLVLSEFAPSVCPDIVLIVNCHLFSIVPSLESLLKDAAALVSIDSEPGPLILGLIVHFLFHRSVCPRT